jgi:hypothetical protein
MSTVRKLNINAIKMREEGADHQLIYDTHVANFCEYKKDYIVPYIHELLETPVVDRRAAHALLMWVNYQWEDIVCAIEQAWPIVDGKANQYAVLFTYKIVSLMVAFDLKPWWYAPFSGIDTSILSYPWMTGQLQRGVEWLDFLEFMSVSMSFEDWSAIYFPMQISETVVEEEPEIIEPTCVVLRDKCHIIVEYPVDREAVNAYHISEFFKNIDTQDELLRQVIARVLVQFYNSVIKVVEKCLMKGGSSVEDASRACYKMMERLRKTNVDNVHNQFHAYHIRLMFFVNDVIDSLVSSGEMGVKVVERVMWHILVSSPNPLHQKMDKHDILYVMLVVPLPEVNVIIPEIDAQDVDIHTQMMKSVLPNRKCRIFILSKLFVKEIVEKHLDDHDFMQRLAQLSLCARVYLTPDGDPDGVHIWGDGMSGVIQHVIPWLQLSSSEVRPERFLFSKQDVSLILFRILRASPMNVSLTRLDAGVMPVDLPPKGVYTHQVDFMDVDPVDDFGIRKQLPPEVMMVFAPVERKTITSDPVTDCNLYVQANRLSIKEVDSYNGNPSQPHLPEWHVVMCMFSSKKQIHGKGEGNTKKIAKAAACSQLLAQLPRDWYG